MPGMIEIQDLSLPELRVYDCRSEVQLLRYFEPEPGIFIAESLRVIGRALDAGYEPLSLLIEKGLLEKGNRELQAILNRCGELPVYVGEDTVLTRITGFHLTRGALCAMRRRPLPAAASVCAGASRLAVLEDVMNQTNVGAVFRSAAALGFDGVLLTKGCGDPLYRRSIRVSMGTVFQIPWTYLDEAGTDYVKALRDRGFVTVAMALREDAVSVDDPGLMAAEKLAVILGTEGEGLRDLTIRACDYTVRIPMARGVDSLNVAAASAVAFWQLGKRRG